MRQQACLFKRKNAGTVWWGGIIQCKRPGMWGSAPLHCRTLKWNLGSVTLAAALTRAILNAWNIILILLPISCIPYLPLSNFSGLNLSFTFRRPSYEPLITLSFSPSNFPKESVLPLLLYLITFVKLSTSAFLISLIIRLKALWGHLFCPSSYPQHPKGDWNTSGDQKLFGELIIWPHGVWVALLNMAESKQDISRVSAFWCLSISNNFTLYIIFQSQLLRQMWFILISKALHKILWKL